MKLLCVFATKQSNEIEREKTRIFRNLFYHIEPFQSNPLTICHSSYSELEILWTTKSMRATIEIGENNQKRRKNADFGYCALVYWMVFKCFDAEKKVFLKLSHFFVSFTFFHWLNSIRMAICLIKCFFWVQFLLVFA